MRLLRAAFHASPQGSPEEAVALIARLVAPGGTVELAADLDPTRLSGRSYPDVVAALGAADRWQDRVRYGLSQRGIAAGEAPEPPVVIVPADEPFSRVQHALSEGHAVAWLRPGGPVERLGLLIVGDPRRARSAAAMITRHQGQAQVRIFDAGSRPLPGDEVLGWQPAPELIRLDLGLTSPLGELRSALARHPVDLLLVTVPTTGQLAWLFGLFAGIDTSLLLVPGDALWIGWSSRLSAFDAVQIDGHFTTRIVQIDGAGVAWEADRDALVAVDSGVAIGAVAVWRGTLRLPATGGARIGLARDPERPIETLVAQVQLLPRLGAPIALVPPDLPEAQLQRLSSFRVWAVAQGLVDPARVRARGPDAVLSADAVLRWGRPTDVPSWAGAVVFDRVARALRAEGYPVALSVNAVGGAGYLHLPVGALGEQALSARVEGAWRPPCASPGLGARLVERCGAQPVAIASLRWLTGNREARERLLALIAGAQREVNLQSYIFDDDAVGRAVASALAGASARGITVRLLVDSLWSGHGSLSLSNPLLQELDTLPHVEVRVCRPVGRLLDLKTRNHRKLLTVDSAVAVIAGRNVSAHYYTGFDEVHLSADTPQGAVPWLDLSVEVTGGVVQHAEASFRSDWIEGGGTMRPIVAPRPDQARAWWVSHHSLQDAAGLDAIREVLSHARQQITLINTFPLQHELQHALLARLRAGVRVRLITGHVRPRHDSGLLPFPGSAERDLMTGLIHARFDPLVEAGAEAYAYGLPSDAWPGLGGVLPHVHAKLVLADGRIAVVGSHNLDISSAYWDSEISLVIDDPAQVGSLQTWVEGLLEASVRFGDGDWRRDTTHLSWLSQRWPSLLS